MCPGMKYRGGETKNQRLRVTRKKSLSLDCMQAVSQVFINNYINLCFYYIINCKISFKMITQPCISCCAQLQNVGVKFCIFNNTTLPYTTHINRIIKSSHFHRTVPPVKWNKVCRKAQRISHFNTNTSMFH